jgi:hypothetical protein
MKNERNHSPCCLIRQRKDESIAAWSNVDDIETISLRLNRDFHAITLPNMRKTAMPRVMQRTILASHN